MSWPQSANPNPLRQRRLRAMKAVILPTFAMSQLHHCFMRPPPGNGTSFIEKETEAQRRLSRGPAILNARDAESQ